MDPTPMYRSELIAKYVDRYTRAHQQAFVKVYRGVLGQGETVVYDGRARIHGLTGAVQMGFGDEPQYMVSGRVSLPLKDLAGSPVEPQVNDVLVVNSHHDEKTVGRSFRVMHVDAGGQFEDVVSLTVVGAEDSPSVQIPGPVGWP